ncbi:DNA-3-methyladenine glycosylase family protein [Leifsonia poae]|uniref:DNA-3-methyladenine glycosylase family protein n=1 Tax=Leifsonia poae TaxID=110933 RepID=UPI001CC1BBA3|nr:DNA-3-methyladenine glycosylase 2 family protein [Leifsonia poae]
MTAVTPADSASVSVAARTKPVTTVYSPAEPVDVRATLSVLGRGPHDPTTRWDARGVWRTFRTPHGSATVCIRVPAGSRGSAVEAAAWGPGAEWAIASVPELLGRGDDWSGLDVGGTPLLRESRRRNAGLKLMTTGRMLEALVPAVVEQRVTSLEAYRSWARLLRWYGEPAPGPAPDGMRVVPTSAQWRGIPSWEWHRAGVDPGRARTVRAAMVVAGSLERATDAAETPDAAARALRTVPGIGAWTAAETLQRSHGDPDAVSVGDYHLAHYVGEALIGRRVDDDGMLELLEPWRGQRQRVIRLILASGHPFERRGPRVALQDHRWH